MLITRELLREWDACYDDENIAALVPEAGLTPLQVLDLDIPVDDRLWVVLREEVLSAKDLRLLAVKWAREALAVAGDPDPRSVAACDVAERFANGETTEKELAAAWASAWAAARAAARYAARYAAGTAARYSAVDAAGTAARDAAQAAAVTAAWAAVWDAARTAAGAAAWASARYSQLADVRIVLAKLGA